MKGRNFACSDLHGQLDLWIQIKQYLKPEDNLYFLGDAIDRGPYGFRIMQDILNRPNTMYFIGNHEDMMYNALVEQIHFDERGILKEGAMDLWFWNGGRSTYKEILKSNISFDTIISQVKDMAYFYVYKTEDKNIVLSHAGMTPYILEKLDHLGYGVEKDNVIYDSLVWNRTHCEDFEWHGNVKDYIVHGHTPVAYFDNDWKAQNNQYAKYYCKGLDNNYHKVDIDLGAHFSYSTCLFNLNTFKVEQYFYSKEKE